MEWYQYGVTRGFSWLWGAITHHSGIDYGAPCGTAITAPVDATVLHSGPQAWGGQIDLLVPGGLPGYEQGPHVLTFLHTTAEYVGAGQQVKAGQVLGTSGKPPPGKGYGSGCHIHFEVTRGNVAPYTSYSPGRNPDATHYPEDPGPFVSNLLYSGPTGGGSGHIGALNQSIPAGTTGATGKSVTGCGPEPAWQDYIGGPLDATYIIDHSKWAACASAGGILDTAGQVGRIADIVGKLGEWALDPLRIAKMVIGLGLVFLSVVLAFLPDFAAAGAIAAGLPEIAGPLRQIAKGGPRGVVKGGLGTAAAIPGAQRRVERQRKRERTAYVRERAAAQPKPPQQHGGTSKRVTTPLRTPAGTVPPVPQGTSKRRTFFGSAGMTPGNAPGGARVTRSARKPKVEKKAVKNFQRGVREAGGTAGTKLPKKPANMTWSEFMNSPVEQAHRRKRRRSVGEFMRSPERPWNKGRKKAK